MAVNRYIAFKEGVTDDVYVIRDGEKIMYSDVPKEGTDVDTE